MNLKTRIIRVQQVKIPTAHLETAIEMKAVLRMAVTVQEHPLPHPKIKILLLTVPKVKILPDIKKAKSGAENSGSAPLFWNHSCNFYIVMLR